MDISRPCQPEKLIPLLPWPGFDPSFSGHNDEQSSASGQDYASDRSSIGARPTQSVKKSDTILMSMFIKCDVQFDIDLGSNINNRHTFFH